VYRRILLVALALSVAGCLDGGTGGTPEATTEPSSTDSPAPSPTTDAGAVTTGYGTDCPYIVSADRATERQRTDTDRRVDYENLSTERQQEFRQAIGGSVEMATLPEVWSGPVLVNYEGEQYYVVASVC